MIQKENHPNDSDVTMKVTSSYYSYFIGSEDEPPQASERNDKGEPPLRWHQIRQAQQSVLLSVLVASSVYAAEMPNAAVAAPVRLETGGAFQMVSPESAVSLQQNQSPVLSQQDVKARISDAITRLTDIANPGHEDYDDEFLPPENNVIVGSLFLLQSALTSSISHLPETLIFPDGTGGIRIEWRDSQGTAILMLSPSESKLFHAFGENRGIEKATSERLLYWLEKFAPAS